MRQFFTLLLTMLLLSAVSSGAQEHQHRFSPEQFDAELQQYITKEACLTPQEAAAFFPVYKEMQKKQRTLMDRQRQLGKIKPADEKGCERAIKQRDEIQLEQKRIRQTYHNRFLSIISASKLYDVIKAEDCFYRQKMKSWGQHKPKK